MKKKQSEKPNEPTEDRDKTDSDTFGKASSQATVSKEKGDEENAEHNGLKPRTYRKIARQEYLRVAQKKKKNKKILRKAIRQRLRYLRRDIDILYKLRESYPKLPFDKYRLKYFYVIRTLYDRQYEMYINQPHTIEDRV